MAVNEEIEEVPLDELEEVLFRGSSERGTIDE